METKEEIKTKEEPKNVDKKELSLVAQAQEAAQSLREQIGLLRIENDRTEQLRSATILGGRGDANQPPVVKQKVSDSDFAMKALRGELTTDDLE